ncbi:type IV toxin-antitoxin system AbiEi family antitoxin domain-containing protein (plasmid) [Rhizobium sp. T1470]|nr:type IV toxin-antitoxin system AbiEi family antitoxin domain-containing protein [Rhizobium favelukesii]MCA0806892.1 type IV toxin-antitoxin system AbiEi family antitoxin domain-containing protein [Rhizobium sp. T1473]MCS0461010.1 type IV toxin-antitoxin system AbiEi family antitoxin domain-containing protein [Rhizobium favelukesii]
MRASIRLTKSIEGLTTLSPRRLQKRLVDCKSIKVKRLFFLRGPPSASLAKAIEQRRDRSRDRQAACLCEADVWTRRI